MRKRDLRTKHVLVWKDSNPEFVFRCDRVGKVSFSSHTFNTETNRDKVYSTPPDFNRVLLFGVE